MSAENPQAFCALCEWKGSVELILGHLRGAHGIDEEPAMWPDGSPVIVDNTLEPDDFSGADTP